MTSLYLPTTDNLRCLCFYVESTGSTGSTGFPINFLANFSTRAGTSTGFSTRSVLPATAVSLTTALTMASATEISSVRTILRQKFQRRHVENENIFEIHISPLYTCLEDLIFITTFTPSPLLLICALFSTPSMLFIIRSRGSCNVNSQNSRHGSQPYPTQPTAAKKTLKNPLSLPSASSRVISAATGRLVESKERNARLP